MGHTETGACSGDVLDFIIAVTSISAPWTSTAAASTASLELNTGGVGYFESANEYSDVTWSYDDEDSVIYITLEDDRNYYASAWTMGGESYVWLLLELEECMVWLLDGRLIV